MRNAFAHVHACESAALTRPCARAACVVQSGLPQCRHLGPHSFDLGPRHVLAVRHRQRLAAQRPGWHEGALHASANLHLQPTYPSLRSTRCSTMPRGRRAPSPPSRTASRAAPRLAVGPFSTTRCSSRCCRCWAALLPVGVAARRPGAARRRLWRLWRLWRRSSAAARNGQLRRASRASPAALAAPHGSPTAATPAARKIQKSASNRASFFAFVRPSVRMPCVF